LRAVGSVVSDMMGAGEKYGNKLVQIQKICELAICQSPDGLVLLFGSMTVRSTDSGNVMEGLQIPELPHVFLSLGISGQADIAISSRPVTVKQWWRTNFSSIALKQFYKARNKWPITI